MPGQIVAVQNYLVPANGKTGAYIFRKTLVAGTPEYLDFRTINLDGQDFWPYGVYMDNREGLADLTLTFDQLQMSYTVGAAAPVTGFGYPGVVDQSVTIEGEGPVTLVFVNYPLIN